MKSVLFVCLGNICRSPAGEGVLEFLVKQRGLESEVYVESCGVGSWHVGEYPDPRMREVAESRGIALTSKAQQFKDEFYDRFDYIMVADRMLFQDLNDNAPSSQVKDKLYLMTHFSKGFQGQDVPDPYYGEMTGFEDVLDILEESCNGLLDHLFKR